MTRLNLVLVLLLLASALSLVHQQYEARRLFVALERANAAAERLASEHEQLTVQQRRLAAPQRVQQLASSRLGMRAIHPGITEVLVLPQRSSGSGALQRLQGPTAAAGAAASAPANAAAAAPGGRP